MLKTTISVPTIAARWLLPTGLGKSLDYEKVMTALQRIHDGQLDPLVLRTGDFPVFLEIETGGKSREELLAEIASAGMFASDYSKDIMSKEAWKPGKKEKVKFARAKVSDLGFTDPNKLPTTTEIWARIRELGHSLCEPQDGPAIRVAFKDQKRGDYFWAAMEQITDSGGNPRVFCVERDGVGRRWLSTNWVDPDSQWALDDEVVFRLCK